MKSTIKTAHLWATLLVGVLLMPQPAAKAQLGTNARISRPSEQSGSALLGRTGGRNTGRFERQFRSPSRSSSGRGNARARVARGSSRRRASRAPARTFAPTGVYATRFSGRLINSAGVTQGGLYVASGMSAATSPTTPLHGRRFALPPIRQALPSAAPPKYGVFQDFFGLTPADKFSFSSGEAPLPVAHSLERDTQRRLERTKRRGIDAFAQGRYADALSHFSNCRRMNSRAQLELMLAVHASLEKQKIYGALVYLTIAIERNPRLFQEDLNLKQYYGDPEAFEVLMRKYARSKEGANQSSAQVIKSYAAWELGDYPTARAALQKAVELGTGKPEQDAILMFAQALRLGLR